MAVKVTERNQKTKDLYERHKEVIEAAGQGVKQFFIKMHYMVTPIKEKAVPMFTNEITQLMGRDAYFEFVDSKLEPEAHEYSPLRTLWRWKFDSDYKKYYRDEQGRIMIPLSKLEQVKNPQLRMDLNNPNQPWNTPVNTGALTPIIGCPDTSRKISDMTVGDLQCLLSQLILTIKEAQE